MLASEMILFNLKKKKTLDLFPLNQIFIFFISAFKEIKRKRKDDINGLRD